MLSASARANSSYSEDTTGNWAPLPSLPRHCQSPSFTCRRTKEHKNDLWVLDTLTWTWTQLAPRGLAPNARRRQAVVMVGERLFLFGGTSPYHGPPLYFTPEQLLLLPQQEEDNSSKLMVVKPLGRTSHQ